MTRSKKSRKPGVGSSGAVKDDNKKTLVSKDKKPKKRTGKKPGNRQQEALKKSKNKQIPVGNKDPRIGSKKPIVLGAASSANSAKASQGQKTAVKKQPETAIAGIRVLATSTPNEQQILQQELMAIEQDEQLQNIIEKQEAGLELSPAEVDFYNDKLARHQEISDLLGEQDEQLAEPSDANSSNELLDDDLWDKLDNDLSEFE